MSNENNLQITLYFVAYDAECAKWSLPFDSQESAQSYADDNPSTKVFSASGMVDLNTMEEIK